MRDRRILLPRLQIALAELKSCSSRLDRYVSFTTKVGGGTLDSNGAEGGARPNVI